MAQQKKFPYHAVGAAAAKFADERMRPVDGWYTSVDVWGFESDAFKAGARFGYRFPKKPRKQSPR